MNIAKFVVLGALDMLDTASGYDILGFLEKRMVSRWTGIKTGSIYNALKSMEKSGEIEVVERVKNGLFPTSTLYTLTEQGRRNFDTMQEEAFLGLYPLYLGFKLALKFNRRRSHEEIRHFARVALAGIDTRLAAMDAYVAALPVGEAPRFGDAFFIEHDRMLLIAEQQWIGMVLAGLESGDEPLLRTG